MKDKFDLRKMFISERESRLTINSFKKEEKTFQMTISKASIRTNCLRKFLNCFFFLFELCNNKKFVEHLQHLSRETKKSYLLNRKSLKIKEANF